MYGRTRVERYVDADGRPRQRIRRLAQADWEVLIEDHHPGFIDWPTFEANQERIARNTRRGAGRGGRGARGAGAAAGARRLRALRAPAERALPTVSAATAARPITVAARSSPRDAAAGACESAARRSTRRSQRRFLGALTPAGVKAALIAAESLRGRPRRRAGAMAAAGRARPLRRPARRTPLPPGRARASPRRPRPGTRLGRRARQAADGRGRARAARARPSPDVDADIERRQLLELGADLGRVWSAPTTTDRDRKQLLRSLLEEVLVDTAPEQHRASLTLRWRGGALTEHAVALRRYQPKSAPTRTPCRCSDDSPSTTPTPRSPASSTAKAASRQPERPSPRRSSAASAATAASPATKHRPNRPTASWSRSPRPPSCSASCPRPCIAGSATASSPANRTRPARHGASASTDKLRARFVEDPPNGWLTVAQARHALGVSRQTVLQRVKRGELKAVHVRNGRQKGLRIQVIPADETLFDATTTSTSAV